MKFASLVAKAQFSSRQLDKVLASLGCRRTVHSKLNSTSILAFNADIEKYSVCNLRLFFPKEALDEAANHFEFGWMGSQAVHCGCKRRSGRAKYGYYDQ
jgi:hypothetical protein